MMPRLVRVLRTASSERYLIQPRPNEDAAALDLHYLSGGNVAGTLVLFEGTGFKDSDVPALVQYLDEVLLPDVRPDTESVSFTVVRGRVVGAYEPERH